MGFLGPENFLKMAVLDKWIKYFKKSYALMFKWDNHFPEFDSSHVLFREEHDLYMYLYVLCIHTLIKCLNKYK